MLIGKAFILLIMKAIDRKTIIRDERKTTPKALKFDFKFNICFVEIIREANIQNWVKNTINKTKSGVTAKNLNNPGEWA